jgi:hypothetical protein
MIDKTAGLPTQIRNLEKRLKEMDASKVKPALIKEITDTIKNLKDMLKEKQEKKEQRAKAKAEKPQEVEAVAVPMAGNIGATAPNAVTPSQPGQPEATPDDQKVNCPLCGGITFNDQAALQQHMEFTHASDIAPTNPGQKLDKTVAAVDPNVVKKVETDPKLAPGVIVPDSVKKHDDIVDRVEKDPKIAPHIISDQEPKAELEKFAVDDKVEPIRGATGSWGHVMRPSGINGDPLVYVKWMDGPIKEKHGEYGGYYMHDLKKKAEEPVAAPQPQAEPICKNCESNTEKQGDLKGNYESLLKDLKEEREAHYAQGNHSWTARLDQKIVDLEKAIAEKFGNNDVQASGGKCTNCGNDTGDTKFKTCSHKCQIALRNRELGKKASGGPELIRQITKATSGHGYEATVYDLTNGRFQQHVPLKINDTNVRMKQPENGTFELKYSGMPEWRPVLQPEFDQWLAEWKTINETNNQKEGAAENVSVPLKVGDKIVDKIEGAEGFIKVVNADGTVDVQENTYKGVIYRGVDPSRLTKIAGAQNAEHLTIMDHSPAQAQGITEGKDDVDSEFESEQAEPAR